MIGTLRAAFGQGRLTEDEYDARVGQVSASQTHADLAALIADIPAGSATARPPTANDARLGVCVVVVAASVLGASSVVAARQRARIHDRFSGRRSL